MAVGEVPVGEGGADHRRIVPGSRAAGDTRAMDAAAARPEPVLRLAAPADREAIDALMKASTARPVPGVLRRPADRIERVHIAHVDPMLIDDGTYLVRRGGRGDRRLRRLVPARQAVQRRGGAGGPGAAAGPGHGAGARAGDVRPRRLDAAGSRHADPRGVRGGGARRGLPAPGADGDAPGLRALRALRVRGDARGPITLPDGVLIPCVAMEMPVSDA